MALCADATESELDAALANLSPCPSAENARPVETGMVMVRGRAGGTGAPFNLGEATVTRAVVTLMDGSGVQGFAYHLGRERDRARKAATLDALWQTPSRREAVDRSLEPVRERIADARALADRRTAATRVNFFTLARGED